MINAVGKLFVLLVFSLSLGFLALAIGVYSNHVHWKSKDPKAHPGVVDKLETKIKEVAYSRDRAEERYKLAYSTLDNFERIRADRQVFYRNKYDMLKTGKDGKGNLVPTPVYQLEIGQGGDVQLRMIPPGDTLVIQSRGAPLLSAQGFNDALNARAKEIDDELAKIKASQEELAALNTTMQGGPNVPGLIKDKEIQVDAAKRAMAQQEYLKPDLANRFAEAVTVLKRENDLRKRLEQLEKAAGRASRD